MICDHENRVGAGERVVDGHGRGAQATHDVGRHEEVVPAQHEPGRAKDRQHAEHRRAAHVVGRWPALVRPAEYGQRRAFGAAAQLAQHRDDPLGDVQRQVLVERARLADEPRPRARRLGAAGEDIGVLRQARSADEPGFREGRARIVEVGGADDLERVEAPALRHQRDLVTVRVDQVGVAVVDELHQLRRLERDHGHHALRHAREQRRR